MKEVESQRLAKNKELQNSRAARWEMLTPSKQVKQQGTDAMETSEFVAGEGSAIEHLLRKITVIGQMPLRSFYCSKKGKFKEVFELIKDGTAFREYITKLNLNLSQYVENNKYKHLFQEKKQVDENKERVKKAEGLKQMIANNEK